MESGAQFVIILGKLLMLEWSALSWDTRDKVCYIRSFQGDPALLMQGCRQRGGGGGGGGSVA